MVMTMLDERGLDNGPARTTKTGGWGGARAQKAKVEEMRAGACVLSPSAPSLATYEHAMGGQGITVANLCIRAGGGGVFS
jgi:hypothetical protein